MVLCDEVFDDGGEAGFVGTFEAFGDVGYDDFGAFERGESVVGVDAVLVFGVEDGVGEFADVVVEGSGACEQDVGADEACGVAGEV